MKFLIVILFFLIIFFGYGNKVHPSKQPHKHLIVVNNDKINVEYYVTSEITLYKNYATFICINNYDFKGTTKKTIYGDFTLKY